MNTRVRNDNSRNRLCSVEYFVKYFSYFTRVMHIYFDRVRSSQSIQAQSHA
jgi:hypothetical protein